MRKIFKAWPLRSRHYHDNGGDDANGGDANDDDDKPVVHRIVKMKTCKLQLSSM